MLPQTQISRHYRPAGFRLLIKLLSAVVIAVTICPEEGTADPQIGIPFNRTYSLEDLGVTRSLRLAFDPIGRLAAIDRNKYVVLNDSSWINLMEEPQQGRSLINYTADVDGILYYSGVAAWGILERRPNGKLEQISHRPSDAPAWVDATNFTFIIPHQNGIYFAGINGIVNWNRATEEQTFIEVPDLVRLFDLDSTIYVSSHSQGICRVDLQGRRIVPTSESTSPVFLEVAPVGDGIAVVSTTAHRFATFDGSEIQDWPNELGISQSAQISNLLSLPDGDLAVSIDGRGLFILSTAGLCQQAFTTPDYHRISELACNEAGVLWVASESEIQKILYSDPVTILDQRSGVPISWPQVIKWRGHPQIVSHGILYEQYPDEDGLGQRFRKHASLPQFGVMGAVVIKDQLLVANRDGVFQKSDTGFVNILANIDVNRLIKIDEHRCLAISRNEIAALEWNGEYWTEPTPRVPGVGFPFMGISAQNSVWIELGVNRAARISIANGEIQTRVFDEFPWEKPSWVHLGVIDQFVVLSALGGEYQVYDDAAEQFTDVPEITNLLTQSPSPIYRPIKDKAGTIWAAHDNGIYAIEYTAGAFSFDAESYKSIRAHIPFILSSGTTDIWVTNGSTLYHVDRKKAQHLPTPSTPILVSVSDTKSNHILYSVFNTDTAIKELPFAQNDLEFQFFSGSYRSANSPFYDFKMSSDASDWTIRSPESSIALTNLKEGDYQLSAQLIESSQAKGTPALATFSIHPPWFRTHWAYIIYWSLAITGGGVAIASFATRSKRRHAYLEALVYERTDELRTTLEKLNEKERKAAILSERNRLAGEIHDSVQQGLSGLALQIEATLKLPELVSSVRSRLAVAKNMVSFTRHEVQQAIWGLESPLLENSDLSSALEKMVELISSGNPKVEFHTTGRIHNLDATTQHHLLRIAQEAVTNSIKHAQAGQISVQLMFADTEVTLEVSDNGNGFQANDILTTGLGHFGLRGMRGRAAKIDGTLAIDSASNRGTTIRVTTKFSNAFDSTNDDN